MELPKLLEKLNLSPNTYVSIGDTFESIVWRDETQITKEFFEEKKSECIKEFELLDYSRNRQTDYPSIKDLVIALYDDNDKQALIEKRAVVKAKYPKPE